MPDSHFPKLNDSNYVEWHYMMAATLMEKDLWDIIDGLLTCPVGSPNYKAVRALIKKNSHLPTPKSSLALRHHNSHTLVRLMTTQK